MKGSVLARILEAYGEDAEYIFVDSSSVGVSNEIKGVTQTDNTVVIHLEEKES